MEQQDYIWRRRIGDVDLTVISDGTIRWAVEQAIDLPEEIWGSEVPIDDNRCVLCGMNVVHLQLNGRSILVDTGLGEHDALNAPQDERLGVERTPGLISGLAAIGVRPEEIDLVIITHGHGDHVTGATVERGGQRVLAFPNARFVMLRDEWEKSPPRLQPDSLLNAHFQVVERLGALDLVDGKTELAPGVTIVPSPGETPGHASVRVESGGQTAYFLGDLFHIPAEVAHIDWAPIGRDRPALARSRTELIDAARQTDALLITAHMPFPGAGRLVAEGARWKWQPVE